MFEVNSPGENCPGGSFMGVKCPWCNCPGEKLFRGNCPEGKSLECNFLGENFIGESCPGGNIQENISRRKVQSSITLKEFHGEQLSKGEMSGYHKLKRSVFFNSFMSYLPPFPIKFRQ